MESKRISEEKLARGLGWFSLGLGLAELAAPGAIARLIGIGADRRTRGVVRACGAREVATGIGILAQPRNPAWLMSRLAGDVLDLALLGTAAATRDCKGRIAGAFALVLGAGVADALATRAALTAPGDETGAHGTRPVARSITVYREPADVYAFWREFEKLPQFMRHLEGVEDLGGGRSRWIAKAPAGRTVEWDAEITEDIPGHHIAWRSLPGAGVVNQGTVTFLPTPDHLGTEVHVELCYTPPGGSLGVAIAKLWGEEPSMQLEGDLRRLKQVLETGEVMRSDASIHRGMHPAQPSMGQMVRAS